MNPYRCPLLPRRLHARAALWACLALAAPLAGCRSETANGSAASPQGPTAPPAPAATPPVTVDDGLSATPDPWTSRLQGRYVLWEDFEGGRVCRITLTDQRTIGGYAVTADDACLRELAIPDDVFAWFINADGWLVLIDVTRKPLLRMEPSPSGGDFYAQRSDQQQENLVLSADDQ